jgi:putative cell wall binding repeat-containing domain protein
VYPAVVGAANPSRPKAELGESTSGWTFQVQLTNLSDTAHTYTLGGQALSESISGSLYTRHSTNWTGKGIDLTFSEGSVTVPAASSATVTVTVNPRAEFASFAAKQTPNGTFVEGAVTFASTDGQPDLTVPYLGFYGASVDTPIFDSPVYGKETIGTSAMTFHGLTLGQLNPFDPEEDIAISTNDRDLYIISRSTDEYARTYATPGTVLLRDVVSLTYTYTNEAGEVVRSYTYGGAPKSRSYSNGRYWEVTRAEDAFDSAPWFDGYDEKGNELPDGKYTLTIEGTTGGASPVTEKLTHVITLDTAPPVISNVAISGEGDARTLSFDATDASPFPGFGFSWTQDGEPFMRQKYYGWGEIGDDGLHHVHFEVPLSQIAERAGGDPSSVYLQVWDWPVNRASVKVDLKAIPMTKLSVSPESATLSVGQSVTLSASHEPADASVTDVVWSSSNEAVATVSPDGVVSAVGAGEATVSVTDPTQPSLVSASATIRVEASVPAPKAGAWKWDGRGWWYRYEDGSYPSSETLVIDGATYRFDASGYMRTGWVSEGGQWYFHAASGAQASGWGLSGVHWYYLNPDGGAMMTGWVQVGSTWYYLSPSGGAMATGWLKEGGHWYYLHHGSGAMATGWVRIYLKWYHFAENGQLIG